MNGFGWGMDGGSWIWMILAIVLVVALIWLLGVRPGRDRSATEDAAATLRSRFARGEITAEEYEQARRVLGIK